MGQFLNRSMQGAVRLAALSNTTAASSQGFAVPARCRHRATDESFGADANKRRLTARAAAATCSSRGLTRCVSFVAARDRRRDPSRLVSTHARRCAVALAQSRLPGLRINQRVGPLRLRCPLATVSKDRPWWPLGARRPLA